MTHTPGPWTWKDYGRSGRLSRAALKGGGNVLFHEAAWPVSEADARLIAAAPELLEAATVALSCAESWIRDQLEGTKSLDRALADLDPVRAAIAKATGEQS